MSTNFKFHQDWSCATMVSDFLHSNWIRRRNLYENVWKWTLRTFCDVTTHFWGVVSLANHFHSFSRLQIRQKNTDFFLNPSKLFLRDWDTYPRFFDEIWVVIIIWACHEHQFQISSRLELCNYGFWLSSLKLNQRKKFVWKCMKMNFESVLRRNYALLGCGFFGELFPFFLKNANQSKKHRFFSQPIQIVFAWLRHLP
jgi:hypothetical protein